MNHNQFSENPRPFTSPAQLLQFWASILSLIDPLANWKKNLPIATYMAKCDISNRYRRSTLGPWWVVISTGIMLTGMGPLYSFLFGIPLSKFFPQIAISLVLWMFVSQSITEGASCLIAAETDLKYLRVDPDVYLQRTAVSNLILLAFNSCIPLSILLLTQNPISLLIGMGKSLAPFLLGLACIYFTIKILAYSSVHLRDIPILTGNIVYVLFFISPVLWSESQLSKSQAIIASVNPIFCFISLIRNSLIEGNSPYWTRLFYLAFVSAVLYLIQRLVVTKFRATIRNFV